MQEFLYSAMCDEAGTGPYNIDLSSSVPVSEHQWLHVKQAINKCIYHMTITFSLLEVKPAKLFAIRLNTRVDLMNQVL